VTRAIKRLAIVFGALIVVLVLILAWTLNSAAGARFALARAQASLDGKLTVARSSGTLAGVLVLEDLRYTDVDAGVDVQVQRASLDLAVMALITRRVRLNDLEIDGVDVALTSVPPRTEDAAEALSLRAPIDILVEHLRITRTNISLDGEPVFVADSLDLVGAWTASGFIVKELALRAPDGSIDLSGTLATADGYSGTGQTTFRWRIDEIEYAGSLNSRSDGRTAVLDIALAEPVAATANATLAQDTTNAWTIAFEAPAFDPARLGATSDVKSLAMTLNGAGDRSGGTLQGEVAIDEHRVMIDPSRFTLADDTLTIQSLSLSSPAIAGSLDARGEVRLAGAQTRAVLQLNWRDVVLPAEWVGQALASAGRLDLDGNLEAFNAEGAFDLGPPGQTARIALKLTGTPQALALETLRLVQPGGGLDASGTITLQPAIGWQIQANATAFDPGAFAAQWPGALDFEIATTGTLTDAGPVATLKLERLGGSLRERRIAGNADLSIKPEFIVDGTATLESGGSRIEIRGRGGSETDASARLDIASLGDWLPDAGGALGGDVRVHGKWPQLDVDIAASGSNIVLAQTRASTLELVADIKNTQEPAGAFTLEAGDVRNGDARFDTLTIKGDGNQASHQISLNAVGRPASVAMDLAGSMRDERWQGTLKTLGLEPEQRNLPRLDLTEPVALGWDGERFTLADSCLLGSERRRAASATRNTTDDDDGSRDTAIAADEPAPRQRARLCVGGDGGSDGSLSMRYRVEHLPLNLLLRLAAPDSPVRLRGELAGQGELTRTAAGALGGNATLGSTAGSAYYVDAGNQALLSYTGFAIDAEFAPQSIQARVSAALDQDGRLDGRLTLSGAPGATQVLDGQIDLAINNLGFLELVTSEVANTKGRITANYAISGTYAAPQLSGALTLKEFSTEVPVAGLKLHDGELSLRAVDAQRFVLEGSIASGAGTLTISGDGGLGVEDAMQLTINGSQFLAADIPAARVVITPELTVERAASGIVVRGTVTVPSANVDFARLPGGGVSATSPDVVITDAEREEAGKAAPITANVTVVLGDNVKLAGFGFDGNVTGQLVVNERPGRATTGTGTLNVGGTYKAYGQDLNIERGRVLFAGTAIDNPGLDLRAVRKIQSSDVTAGLLVRGTAQVPVLTVFSEPAMEQSEALSYLITGKPLSSLKSGEGDMLGAAARALGTAGGDLLAKSIGGRLGIDDIGVTDNTALGGAAFTVGKFLSPKLYISYGIGIFEPGEVVTLRYLFHTRWNLEAQSATTGNRAGINYRYER